MRCIKNAIWTTRGLPRPTSALQMTVEAENELYDILDEVYDDESLSKDDVIKSLLEKKFRNQDLSDPKTKMRAANFLIRKGFNFGDINSYLT